MKHLFIINPTSGKGKTKLFIPIIESIFSELDDEYIIEFTEYTGHATELTRKYVSEDIYRVYSIGGDGTLNEVLNGLIGSDSSLAVVPAGSGNDYARTIYGALSNNSEMFLKELILGDSHFCDTVKVNNRFFINIASTGLDALVVKQAIKFKKLPFISGSLAYYLAIFTSLLFFKIRPLKISLDTEVYDTSPVLIAFGNGMYYGGGKKVLPFSSVNDGKLSICIAHNLNKLTVLKLFPILLRGEHADLKKYIIMKKSDSLEISSEFPMILNLDGELLECTHIKAEVLPNSVQIIFPYAEENSNFSLPASF